MSPLARMTSFSPAIMSTPLAAASTPQAVKTIRQTVERYSEAEQLLRTALRRSRPLNIACGNSTRALSHFATTLHRLGRADEAGEVIAEAAHLAERAGNGIVSARIREEANVAISMAQMGLTTDALRLIEHAWTRTSELTSDMDPPRHRCRARASVIEAMAKIAVLFRDPSLLELAWQRTGTIVEESDPYPNTRSSARALCVRAMAELAVALQDRSYLDRAEERTTEIEARQWRLYAEARIFAAMAELAIIRKDTELLAECEDRVDKMAVGRYRMEAEGAIAVALARFGRVEEAWERLEQCKDGLFEQCWDGLTAAPAGHELAASQMALISKMGELAVAVRDKDRFRLAWQYSLVLEHPHDCTLTQVKLIEEQAQLAVALQDRELIQEAWSRSRQIERSDVIFETHAQTQAFVALTMAKMGMMDDARHALKESWLATDPGDPMPAFKDGSREPVLQKMAELAELMVQGAESMAAPFGGVSGQRFRDGVAILIKSQPFTWTQHVGALPQGLEWLQGSELRRQDVGLFGRVSTSPLLDAQERKAMRRSTLQRLRQAEKTGDRKLFNLMTTTLRAFGDAPATQLLLEIADSWADKHFYQDPRFPQLLSTLIKTGHHRAISFVMQILGEPSFRGADDPEHSPRLRMWLLKKLAKAGHLESELAPYLEEKLRHGMRPDLIDRWLVAVMQDLGIMPTVAAMRLFMDKEWSDDAGKRLSSPEQIISHLKGLKAMFERETDPLKLVQMLAEDDQQALLYNLIFAGGTRFAYAKHYNPKQFHKMLKAITNEVGPIHEETLNRFEAALAKARPEPAGDVTNEQIMDRLRKGQWPLSETPYAKELRIDVSSEKILQGLEERFQDVFSPNQLGAMLIATLAPDVITKPEATDPEIATLINDIQATEGLQPLPPLLKKLEEKIPDLAKRIAGKWGRRLDEKLPVSLHALLGLSTQAERTTSALAFRLHIETELRSALISRLRSQRNNSTDAAERQAYREAIDHVPHASADEILVSLIASILKTNGKPVPLLHAAQWRSHLEEILHGLEAIGARSEVETEKTVTLRYLDKLTDLVTFLRSTDGSPNCFASDDPKFRERHERYVPRLWKDPLSFIFLIEDNAPDAKERVAIGFVFGSFGIKDGRPVVLLNGVYMEDKTNEAVLSILAAIETYFARPLGASHQFVSARAGGQTYIDPKSLHATGGEPTYSNESTEVTRLRALTKLISEEPERDIFDDLYVGINELMQTRDHVWRKKLQ